MNSVQGTQTRARRVPQELVDMIVASLQGKLRKETLASCSLVCRSWTPISSKYLFEEFSWPCAIGDKPCCKEGSGIGCFARLRELLSSCRRVSNAIRTLRLKRHARRNAERSSVPISFLLQVLDTLPHLRMAKLPFAFSVMLSPVSDVELWPMIPRTRSLEELQIEICDSASIVAALDLLSTFTQITKLTFHCIGAPDVGRPRSYPPSPTLEVQSLTIYENGDTPTSEVLRGLIDFKAIRSLSLPNALKHTQFTLAPLVRSMPALTSLEYKASKLAAPVGLPANLRLPWLGLIVDLPLRCWCYDRRRSEEDMRAMCQWGPTVRDLEVMVTADTRNVHITLVIEHLYAHPITSTDRHAPSSPEEIAIVQEKTFSQLDWASLESVAQRWPAIETLRIWLRYRDAQPAMCIEILRNAASRALSSAVAGRLLIDHAVERKT